MSVRAALLALAVAATSGNVRADPVEDFYRGKVLNIYIGTGEGLGAVWAYPQLLSEVIGHYIPGHPTIVVRSMPGAGGFKVVSYIQSVGPQDGTAWGFVTRGVFRAPLLKRQGADFDPLKLQWIGSPAREPSLATVWADATPVRSLDDAMRTEVVYGATSMGTDTGLFPLILNELIGTKFKVVSGYKSMPEVDLAIQRGEAQGKIWTWASLNSERSREWYEAGKVKILAQIGLEKGRDIPDAPLAIDYAKSPADRQLMELVFSTADLGYPSFMGPGVPKERIDALRMAFHQTMDDPQFRALMQKQNLAFDPMTGPQVEAVIRRLYAMPADVVERASKLIPPS